VAELFLAAQQEFARDGEAALVFPSLAAAWRCADYAKRRAGASPRLESYGWGGLTAVLLEEEAYGTAWKYWQHSGEIVSSREAQCALSDHPLDPAAAESGEKARAVLRDRIAAAYEGVEPGDVFLFSSGMGAIAAVHRVLAARAPERPTLQIEFPYLDAYKVQEQFGAGVVDFTLTESGGVDEALAWLAGGGEAAGAFTEIPSNPLLRTADLPGLGRALRERGIPLVVDDTVATPVNVAALRYADAITSSLTKVFSGAGDVAAGVAVLSRESPFHEALAAAMGAEEAASPLFAKDAAVLELNSRHFVERVEATNEIAAEVVEAIRDRPEVERLWHPLSECRGYYDAVRREGGGYGALFSLRLKGGEAAAARFYDALEISKGPSLGTNFSLACPYTLLAHYQELAWAEERGAASDLLRVWIGLEEAGDLIERFEAAFEAV